MKVVFGSPIFTKSGDNIDDITALTMKEIKNYYLKTIKKERYNEHRTIDNSA